MDHLPALTDRLAQAEARVALGDITRQHGIIARLDLGGDDAFTSGDLLALFEELQVHHVASRDRLKSEIAKK